MGDVKEPADNEVILELGSLNKAYEPDEVGLYTKKSEGSTLPDVTNDAQINGSVNKAYVPESEDVKDEPGQFLNGLSTDFTKKDGEDGGDEVESEEPQRDQWGNSLEFLMSCIAMSVGLGNVWRFPFTAYENGGGAFLIPYIIVLVLIGKPLYYLELAIGQFTNYGCVKMWNMVPALVGIGYGQIFATFLTVSYYCSLLAITLVYFVFSFNSELPWARCDPQYADECFDSYTKGNDTASLTENRTSSSEIFFMKLVLHEIDSMEDGIGVPDWRLTLGLLFSWVSIFFIIIKGVKSSGKASYFLALFPYVVMIALLVRGATLPGAVDGILFFITPQWDQLANVKVWYAAVTQSFFSLSVCFGPLVMYSSYNEFNHQVHRDALIVTSLDTATSLLAGCTIFSILGNLAYEMGTTDISKVVQGGTGLAFISYPDAIAKFDAVPQLFAVLFFIMLFTLGLGSAVALESAVNTIICDSFPKLKPWMVSATTCTAGFLVGLCFVTPAGQWILDLVDYYDVTLVVFVLAAVEMLAVAWIYGTDNFCQDLEFMQTQKVSIYWRVCWGFITPVLLIFILLYSLGTSTPKQHNGNYYDTTSYGVAWALFAFGVLQLPIWMFYRYSKTKPGISLKQAFCSTFSPSEEWGPKNTKIREEWIEFKTNRKRELQLKAHGRLRIFLQRYLGFGSP